MIRPTQRQFSLSEFTSDEPDIGALICCSHSSNCPFSSLSIMDVVQNEWQQGELQCFKDPMTMLFGWFCSLCLVCKNAKDLGESVPMYCCLSCFCPVVGICLLRQKTREKYGIEGDTTKDVLCSCCCSACVNCQTASEIKAREEL